MSDFNGYCAICAEELHDDNTVDLKDYDIDENHRMARRKLCKECADSIFGGLIEDV